MLRKLFIGGNVALLALILAAIVKDTVRPWKPYQRAYRRLQAEQESAPEIKRQVLSRAIEIKQILTPDLEQVDRCITCHQGMDPIATPSLENAFHQQPYKAHPGGLLKNHAVERYGCVICHAGQGLATTFIEAAHTPRDEAQKAEWRKRYRWKPAEHWERPMLTGVYLQAGCIRCHGNFESLPGAEATARGKTLLRAHGCFGCHQWKGEGGPISVDLAEETANKPLSRIDFSHTGLAEDEHTLLSWIRLHLVSDPAELTPGDPEAKFNAEAIAPSGMPDYRGELSPEDADAITTYILSQAGANIPHAYHVDGPREPAFEAIPFGSSREAGKWVFDKYGCAGCHGLEGRLGRRNFNYTGGEEPSLTKTVGTYTREELRKKIQDGVLVVSKDNPKGPTPPLYMPAWKDKIKGRELDVLMDYLFSIAEKGAEW